MKRAVPEQFDLGEIGGEPADKDNVKKYNAFQVRPVSDIASIPRDGYTGQLLKASPVSKLQQALAESMEVPTDAVCLAHEGRDLQLGLPFKDNGVSELGPTARKAGMRVELVFTLASGALPGKVVRAKKLKQERAQEASRRAEEEAARVTATEKTRLAEERRAVEAKAQAERDEEAMKEKCSFRVQLFGGSDFSGVCVRLPRRLTVGHLARQLMVDQGIQLISEVGVVLIADQGRPLTVEEPVAQLHGSKVLYYAEAGPEKLTPSSPRHADRVVIQSYSSSAEADRIEAGYGDA